MAFLRMKTTHGHFMADVYSCFQKSVRRGDFAESVYWGSQIAMAGTNAAGEEFKGYPNALKKRLMQHALEDVGSLEFAVKLLGAKADSWNTLVPWIKVLCEMPKTRAAAWLNRLAVEYVTDPESAPCDEFRRGAEALVLHRDEKKKELAEMFSKDVMNVYKELNKEVLAFHADVLRESLPKVTLPEPEKTVAIPAAWLEKRDVPDLAYDKHTAKGKAMGRGYEHFFDTMIVAPALFPEGDRYAEEAKALYLNGKEQRVRQLLAATSSKVAEKAAAKEAKKAEAKEAKKAAKEEAKAAKKAEKEAAKAEAKAAKAAERKAAKEAAGPQYVEATAPPASYTKVLQIQPITGRAKARVWFATTKVAKKDKQVVIKGPVKSEEAEAILKTETLKKTLCLPHANIRIEESDGKKYIVADNLVGDYTAFPTKIITTKLEKDITVIDTEKANMSVWDNDMLDNAEKAKHLLIALAFRKVAGANDTCARNMVVVGDLVYSVDDAALEKETAHMWSKGLVKPKAAFETALEKHWDHVQETLADWKEKVPAESYAAKQIAILSAKDGWKW